MADTTHDKYLENGRFKVEITGCNSSKFCMAVAIDPMKVEIKDYSSGDHNQFRALKPNAVSFGTATFTFHVDKTTHNKDIYDWLDQTRKGETGSIRKDITVDMCDRKRAVVRSFHLHECFPILHNPGEYGQESKALELQLQVQIGYVSF
ncbi:MAG: phage tail protein [Polyangiaceae bacterium]